MSVIKTNDLHKSYGAITALENVSISVEPGQIFGLLGQNGAGKSTMIKILLGIVRKTSGEATLLNEEAGAVQVRQRVGYLPEDHRFPGYHTGVSLLHYYGQLYGLRRPERQKRIAEMLQVVGLHARGSSKIKTYSKGMKQRLGLAQAIFHDPEVIFLDEPTDGVDPIGRKEIRDLLLQLREEGRTIFINSHLLGEVEMISDRVVIMHRGELIREGTVADLTKTSNRFTLGLASGDQFPVEEVERLNYKVEIKGDFVDVELTQDQSIDPVIQLLHERKLRLRHLSERKQSLEDVFLSVVDQKEPANEKYRRVARALPVGGR